MLASALCSRLKFEEIDPRSLVAKPPAPTTPGAPVSAPQPQPIVVQNQLTVPALVKFLSLMVTNFVSFPPLGTVLVVLLGVGVAEHVGLIQALVKALLSVTPKRLVTPMVILVAMLSHAAADTGYVLVVPLGGVIFASVGRHPLTGIVAAFAGVSGGFSANLIPSGLDPLLAGITQPAAQIIDPSRQVAPLCNTLFLMASCLLLTGAGWFVTDRIIEPRIRPLPIDGDAPGLAATRVTPLETKGLLAAAASVVLFAALMAWWCFDGAQPDGKVILSPFKASDGSLVSNNAPLMKSIVSLMFLGFLIPGLVYGLVTGSIRSDRDVVQGMSKSMATMAHYLVLAFMAAQFIYVFNESNLGVLLAVKGANFLTAMKMPGFATVLGLILLTAAVNLLIGSASAKWALLAPIFVPMLMQLRLAPELTQAAYRVGDSSTNIITPLMPYLPLIVGYAQRYVKQAGVGTVISLMIPYSLAFLLSWTVLLLVFWQLGLPLGIPPVWGPAGYELPAP